MLLQVDAELASEAMETPRLIPVGEKEARARARCVRKIGAALGSSGRSDELAGFLEDRPNVAERAEALIGFAQGMLEARQMRFLVALVLLTSASSCKLVLEDVEVLARITKIYEHPLLAEGDGPVANLVVIRPDPSGRPCFSTWMASPCSGSSPRLTPRSR